MPGTHVALLRGVNNIGATTRVTMADLRCAFEALGFSDVRTLLNSGNVVFTVPAELRADLGTRVEKGLTRLDSRAAVILLRARELVEIVRDNPLNDVATRSSDLLVTVVRTTKDLQLLRPLLEVQWAPEVLALGRRGAYQWCANGIAKSPLRIAVERALGRAGTGRNIGTLTKLVAVLEAPRRLR